MINIYIAITIAILVGLIVAEFFIICRQSEQIAALRNKVWKNNQPLQPVYVDKNSWWFQK